MSRMPGVEHFRGGADQHGGAEENGGLDSTVGRQPTVLSQIIMKDDDRLSTGIGELDRVLGGGIVAGSLTLVGGDPGIGKSTLLLQMCRLLAADGKRCFTYQERNR